MSDDEPAESVVEASGRTTTLQTVGVEPGEAVEDLVEWADHLLDELSPGSRAVVRLVTSDEMRRLNRTYRDRDEPTDVLSFPADETPESDSYLGDIVVALPVAERQAEEHGHPPSIELKVLVLHGLLHCMGYDHEKDDGEMEAIERRLRRLWIPTTPIPGAPVEP